MARIKYKEAAGLEVKKGRPPRGTISGKTELEKLYTQESLSIREIAEILGCTKDMIYRSLKEYDIERRDRLFKSKLNKYSFEFLEKEIKNKGYMQVASELEVETHTLVVHFNRRKTK